MKAENKILNLFHATTMSRGLQIIKDGKIRTDAPSVICWSLETTPGWIYLSDQLDNAVHWGNKIACGFAPIFPDTCYHLTHYWLAAVDIPVASDNPVHYADAIRYNARMPLQGSLLPLTRLVWA